MCNIAEMLHNVRQLPRFCKSVPRVQPGSLLLTTDTENTECDNRIHNTEANFSLCPYKTSSANIHFASISYVVVCPFS